MVFLEVVGSLTIIFFLYIFLLWQFLALLHNSDEKTIAILQVGTDKKNWLKQCAAVYRLL